MRQGYEDGSRGAGRGGGPVHPASLVGHGGLADEDDAIIRESRRGQRMTLVALALACLVGAIAAVQALREQAEARAAAVQVSDRVSRYMEDFDACAFPGVARPALRRPADRGRHAAHMAARYGRYYGERLQQCRHRLAALGAELDSPGSPEALEDALVALGGAVRGLDGAWGAYAAYLTRAGAGTPGQAAAGEAKQQGALANTVAARGAELELARQALLDLAHER